jgi:hypothetical protein
VNLSPEIKLLHPAMKEVVQSVNSGILQRTFYDHIHLQKTKMQEFRKSTSCLINYGQSNVHMH